MLSVFKFIFSLHLIFDLLIFLLANIYILVSPTLFDAVNNSLGMLILNMVHFMGSKYFLRSFYGSYNDIYTDGEFMRLSTAKTVYKPIEFYV